MSTAKMNRPATIDGIALIASVSIRTGIASLPPTSLRNTAVMMPSGTDMSAESPTTSSVPTIACHAPPCENLLSLDAVRIVVVRNEICSPRQPRTITAIRIAASGINASAAALVTITRTRLFVATTEPHCWRDVTYTNAVNVSHHTTRKPRPPENTVSRS